MHPINCLFYRFKGGFGERDRFACSSFCLHEFCEGERAGRTRYEIPNKMGVSEEVFTGANCAESDTWRKIRDFEGIEGWVHQRMLSGRRRAIVIEAIQQLRRAPERTAKTIALFEPGVILRLDKCSEAWCLVESGAYEGWIHRKSIWGVDSNDYLTQL